MKILLCSPYIRYGGAEKQFRMLMSVLESQGFDFNVVSAKNDYEFDIKYRDRGVVFSNDFDFKSKGITRYLKAIYFYIFVVSKFYKGGYDTFYTYSLYCFPVAILVKLASFFSKKSVKVIYSERILNNFVRKSSLLSIFYRMMDVVVVNSSELAEFFSKDVKLNKVVLINNYVSPIDWNMTREKNIFRIAIPARINREKNQVFVLKCLDSINSVIDEIKVEIHLYGEVDDDVYFSEISSFIANKSAFYHGVKDIEYIYSSNDLICLPSTHEGTSNVVLEAMLSKKDFICSNIEPNVAVPVHSGCIFDFTQKSLLDVIGKFITHGADVEKINSSNYLIACDRYSIDAFRMNITGLFTDLAGNK